MRGNADENPLQLPLYAYAAGHDPNFGMIEIFRTNVERKAQANFLLEHLGRRFPAYTASFDLEDRDRVLRIASSSTMPDAPAIIGLLAALGFCAEVLDDEAETSIPGGLLSAIFITK